MLLEITEPQSPQEFGAYYLLRYEVLRKPWNKPQGSEKDELEGRSIHIMALENKVLVGVARLQLNSPKEAQLRYMAVNEKMRGKGIGKKLIEYAENKAIQKNATKIILQARENAVPFYQVCGYTIVKKSFLMWDEIQHYLMEKKL